VPRSVKDDGPCDGRSNKTPVTWKGGGLDGHVVGDAPLAPGFAVGVADHRLTVLGGHGDHDIVGVYVFHAAGGAERRSVVRSLPGAIHVDRGPFLECVGEFDTALRENRVNPAVFGEHDEVAGLPSSDDDTRRTRRTRRTRLRVECAYGHWRPLLRPLGPFPTDG
jgi:hypothetical protein